MTGHRAATMTRCTTLVPSGVDTEPCDEDFKDTHSPICRYHRCVRSNRVEGSICGKVVEQLGLFDRCGRKRRRTYKYFDIFQARLRAWNWMEPSL
jgi:hypothetical protein